jgi:hypothetical protein
MYRALLQKIRAPRIGRAVLRLAGLPGCRSRIQHDLSGRVRRRSNRKGRFERPQPALQVILKHGPRNRELPKSGIRNFDVAHTYRFPIGRYSERLVATAA